MCWLAAGASSQLVRSRADTQEEPTLLTPDRTADPTPEDHAGLDDAVEVAVTAAGAGEEPYAAVLVAGDGIRLQAAHNRTAGGDPTAHAELELARWAAGNLTGDERAAAVVYCSAEPCPMCAGALGWVGLGRVVYAVAATTIAGWMERSGQPPAPVAAVPVRAVLPDTAIVGPLPAGAPQVTVLQQLLLGRSTTGG